ncbi:MAG: hypothetical protein JWO19_4794 [Bryobacterales bacterium]|nr:hypothetical protein [Bryobacterales bacterium]
MNVRARSVIFFGGLAAVLLSSVPARAAAVINSDILSVVHGTTTCSVSASEPDSAAQIFFLNASSCAGLQVDSSQLGSFTILTEPNNTRSDIFGVADLCRLDNADCDRGEHQYVLAFVSDSETSQAHLFYDDQGTSNAITLAEGSGGPFSATRYLSSSLQQSGWTASFSSDLVVPEPASLGIMFLGLLAIGLYARQGRVIKH